MRDSGWTYDEVMLDWAIAELRSPSWKDNWYGPTCDAWRAKLEAGGINALDAMERIDLIRAIEQFRRPLISKCDGPYPSWTFWRASVSQKELSQFSIVSAFFTYSASSFDDLSGKIRNQPSHEEESMRAKVVAIQNAARKGQLPIGLPIAIIREGPMTPLLIEGYKRSMAALWSGAAVIKMFLCHP